MLTDKELAVLTDAERDELEVMRTIAGNPDNGDFCDTSIGIILWIEKYASAESARRALESERRWIPVGERLPEPALMDFNGEVTISNEVLVFENEVAIAAYCFPKKHWTDMDGEVVYPSHWQPLPSPPDAKEEDNGTN